MEKDAARQEYAYAMNMELWNAKDVKVAREIADIYHYFMNDDSKAIEWYNNATDHGDIEAYNSCSASKEVKNEPNHNRNKAGFFSHTKCCE